MIFITDINSGDERAKFIYLFFSTPEDVLSGKPGDTGDTIAFRRGV
tara:strand:+ start:945 stop:1082 length:138 start_codon:yes stop_codon:yes gene_type:complete